eukprot:scaffold8183_cov122-Isochrysis_galbana.AAC.10
MPQPRSRSRSKAHVARVCVVWSPLTTQSAQTSRVFIHSLHPPSTSSSPSVATRRRLCDDTPASVSLNLGPARTGTRSVAIGY